VTDFRKRLRSGETVYGIWSLLGSAVVASASAEADFVVADLQHGLAAECDIPAFAGAAERAGVVPLVRTRSPLFPDIGRVLDLGGHGVLIPNVRDREHVRQVVAASRYGPDGTRSIGRLLGGSDDPACLIVLETQEALDDLEAIVEVEGLDGIYVGPKDLGLSMSRNGETGQGSVPAAITRIAKVCTAAGLPFGVHAVDSDDASRYVGLGATIVTAAVDVPVMASALGASLAATRAMSWPRT